MKYSKSTIKRAVGFVRDKGYSYAAAGKAIGGASRDTVKRWCDEAGVRSDAAATLAITPATPRTAALAPDPEPLPDEDDSLDGVLRGMRAELRRIKAQIKEAYADGNGGLASKLTGHAVKIADRIAQTQLKMQAPENGGHAFTTDQLKAAEAHIREIFDKLRESAEAKLGLCPDCGARLRMARASEPYAQTPDKEPT